MVNPMSEPTKPAWDWRTYTIGILVALGVASTWIAAKLGGEVAPESKWLVECASSHVVFAQKKRCGFVDLGELVTAEGCVIGTKTHNDGDRSINIRPDKPFERLLYYQGRKTKNYLHVEFMPCEREYVDVEAVLEEIMDHYNSEDYNRAECSMRVRVTGRWAYDGVDHRGVWRDQLGNCLGGRGPDPDVGWTEIHPAYTVEVLNASYPSPEPTP